MASADQKKDAAIKAVKELFRDTSVSRSTTKELLQEVESEINDLICSIEIDDDEDE